MKEAYAIILPSLSEVSPNFILEAVSFNKPFIVTKETGLVESLKDIGLFADPLSVGDIKSKIEFLLENHNYMERKKKIESFNFTHTYKEIAREIIELSEKI